MLCREKEMSACIENIEENDPLEYDEKFMNKADE